TGLLDILLDDVSVAPDAPLGPRDPRPGLAEIARPERVRRHVAERMTVDRDVRAAVLEPARVHRGDASFLAHARDVGGDVGPGLAAVPRYLDVAVVGPGPDHAPAARRLADGVDRRVHLRGGVVHRDAARLLLLLLHGVVRRERGRDALPVLPAVSGAEQELPAEVDRPLRVGAGEDGRVPVEAELLLVARLGLDVAGVARLAVEAADVAALRLGVDVVRIGGIGDDPET